MRLGPAPTTSSRHQPRTAHNAASPRPDTRPPPHPRPPPRAPPQTPIATTIHPRDPAETTQRPPPTTAAGGGQAGRHAGWPAGGQIGRGWRRTASGGRRSAVGDRHAGTRTRRRPVRQSQQIARGVERRAAGGRQSAAWRPAAGGLRQRKRPRNGLWGRSRSNSRQPPPTPPHQPVPRPVPPKTGKRPRGNGAKTQSEGSRRRRGRAATAPTPVSPKRFCKQRDKWQGPWIAILKKSAGTCSEHAPAPKKYGTLGVVHGRGGPRNRAAAASCPASRCTRTMGPVPGAAGRPMKECEQEI